MVKQPRQMQKLWSMRGCGSRILFRREDMNYTTSIIWMKLGFTMGTLYYLSFPIIKLILGYCRMAPDRGLSDHRQAGVKGNKNRLTLVFTSNVNGSDKCQVFIIGKAAQPRVFQKKSGAQLGFYYQSNANAWMTAQLYQKWILQWDHELRIKKRKFLLLQDNFSGHIVPLGLQNIRVENFKANLTAHVQPNDQGIPPANVFKINQLEAIRMIESAWHNVNASTIRNCWDKARILPNADTVPSCIAKPSIPISALIHNSITPTDPIAYAEQQVELVLDKLVS